MSEDSDTNGWVQRTSSCTEREVLATSACMSAKCCWVDSRPIRVEWTIVSTCSTSICFEVEASCRTAQGQGVSSAEATPRDKESKLTGCATRLELRTVPPHNVNLFLAHRAHGSLVDVDLGVYVLQ